MIRYPAIVGSTSETDVLTQKVLLQAIRFGSCAKEALYAFALNVV